MSYLNSNISTLSRSVHNEITNSVIEPYSTFTILKVAGRNEITLSLKDGLYSGQIKHIMLTVRAANVVVTPDNFKDGTTITFSAVGDCITLIFNNNSQWQVLEVNNVLGNAQTPRIK